MQTIYAPELDSASGSVSQVREVTSQIVHRAKSSNMTTFLVGHVTKEGSIAGPRLLEHMVDTVLYFESTRTGPYRFLRAHKNRFGSTNEMGVFEMRDTGLGEVANPSEFFLAERSSGKAGSAVAAADRLVSDIKNRLGCNADKRSAVMRICEIDSSAETYSAFRPDLAT